jgi:hypothetical protein
MTALAYRFSPSDLCLKTVIGIREPHVISIPKETGAALYGPYIDLLPGRYEAVIVFDPTLPCEGRAMMDVCAGAGTHRLTGASITADGIRAGGMSARLGFSCSGPPPGVEVRLVVNGEFNSGIVSVEIRGELDESALKRVSISDLPVPGVENCVRKGRN